MEVSFLSGLIKFDLCAWRSEPSRTLDAPDAERTVKWKEGGGERLSARGEGAINRASGEAGFI